jgi:hypothetical protein
MLPRLVLVVLPCVLFGCVDPAAEFDDFNQRLADRTQRRAEADAMQGGAHGDGDGGAGDAGPDVSTCTEVTAAMLAGTYFFAFRSAVAADTPILALLDVTPRTADASGDFEADVVFRPVATADGKTPRGRTSPGVMKVKADGSYTVDDFAIFIAGAANPVVPGSDFEALVNLSGTLCGHGEAPLASLCGSTLGDLTSPVSVNLDGSTYGALRVSGDELPGQAGSCAETAGN